MRAIRDLWSELIERRLWPVALLLVAALVAVPLLLVKSSPGAGDGTAASTPAPVASAADLHTLDGPVVSVAEHGDTTDAPLRGHEKNPFRQQHVPPEPKAAKATDTTSTTPASTPSDTGSTGTSGGSGGGGAPDQPPAKTYVRASVDLRFGPAAGALHKIDDVPRLTPLPNAAHPVVVFIGMRRDHETAVFLVSTDVRARGEGRCVPSKSVCQAIELREGQVAFLDFRADDGTVTQYELDLDRITLHETTSKAEAQSAYARVSRAGARLLRRAAHSSGIARGGPGQVPQRIPFRYAAGSGVLHIAPYVSRRLPHAHGALLDDRAVADPRASAGP
jgi:hypothetical protein